MVTMTECSEENKPLRNGNSNSGKQNKPNVIIAKRKDVVK